jgi:hypothetical protein
MSHVIWKFRLDVHDMQEIEMPQLAQILSVGTQGGTPQLWALVDELAPKVRRKIRTIGTGHPIDGHPGRFIGTYMMCHDSLVFHVFDAGIRGTLE